MCSYLPACPVAFPARCLEVCLVGITRLFLQTPSYIHICTSPDKDILLTTKHLCSTGSIRSLKRACNPVLSPSLSAFLTSSSQPDCPLQPTQSICFCTSWLSVFLQKDSFPRVSEIDNPKRGNPAKREEILIEVQTEALENNAQQENRYIKDARLSRSPGK